MQTMNTGGIVSLFKHGFCNAVAEGVNNRIQLLMQESCGYRNRERLKTDILFHFGGLNMAPRSAQWEISPRTRKRRILEVDL